VKQERAGVTGRPRLIGAAVLRAAVGAVALLLLQSGLTVARAQSGPAVQATAPSANAAGKDGAVSGVEEMIAHLHESFHITPAQEPLWEKVAKVMRDNAAELTELAKGRLQSAERMTAVDDLKSYAHISEVHAQGTQRLIPVFQALYESMSMQQKQQADREFREHYHRHPQAASPAPH
jgi:hypothetical protein